MPERKLRILLVEDELNVGLTLSERLRREGYEVAWAKSLAEARAFLNSGIFALALLDVGLPDGLGFDLSEELRENRPETAIVFLTARSDPDDRVRGLELGAEDYIVKPFHLRELLLRIERSLARARALAQPGAAPGGPLRVGEALVSFAGFTAEAHGRTHALTHRECLLLRLLVERKGVVVSRDEILDRVWSENEFPSPRTVDNFVVRLRKLVERDPERPSVIKSVRGVGYLLDEGSAT